MTRGAEYQFCSPGLSVIKSKLGNSFRHLVAHGKKVYVRHPDRPPALTLAPTP